MVPCKRSFVFFCVNSKIEIALYVVSVLQMLLFLAFGLRAMSSLFTVNLLQEAWQHFF